MSIETSRAKFKVEKVTEVAWSPTVRIVNFSAVCYGSEENNSYHKHTPSGQVELMVDNPNLHDFFKLGKEYYVDFTPAPETK